jgi:hypothetical protein
MDSAQLLRQINYIYYICFVIYTFVFLVGLVLLKISLFHFVP